MGPVVVACLLGTQQLVVILLSYRNFDKARGIVRSIDQPDWCARETLRCVRSRPARIIDKTGTHVPEIVIHGLPSYLRFVAAGLLRMPPDPKWWRGVAPPNFVVQSVLEKRFDVFF
jgi:hypothetical protein